MHFGGSTLEAPSWLARESSRLQAMEVPKQRCKRGAAIARTGGNVPAAPQGCLARNLSINTAAGARFCDFPLINLIRLRPPVCLQLSARLRLAKPPSGRY